MGELKLYGMKVAYDKIVTTAERRQHEPQRVVCDLLKAEIAEKRARLIKYQITIAKLPLVKDIDEFAFDGTPVNETLVRDLAGGDFSLRQKFSGLTNRLVQEFFLPQHRAKRVAPTERCGSVDGHHDMGSCDITVRGTSKELLHYPGVPKE